jgi:hypothetical protein
LSKIGPDSPDFLKTFKIPIFLQEVPAPSENIKDS